MIHITAQMRVLVAIEAVDGRKGIDSLVRVCQEKLSEDPISGCVFVFRSRRGTSIRLLSYNGQIRGSRHLVLAMRLNSPL
jgi:transposase